MMDRRRGTSLLYFAGAVSVVVVGLALCSGDGIANGVDSAGTITRSNELQSSGSDDAGLLGVGMLVFVFPAAFALVAIVRPAWLQWCRVVCGLSLALLAFVTFLVQLDTDLIGAISLGDTHIAAGLAFAVLPLVVDVVWARFARAR